MTARASRSRPRNAFSSRGPVDRGEPPRDSRHAIDARRRHQEPERRGDARARRADRRARCRAACDFAGVERAAAAGREQRELARVPPALGHVHARRGRHVLVDDRVDAPRESRRPTASIRRRAARIAASARARSMAIVPPAKVAASRKPSTRLASVTVGVRAAASVAGGPRRRARAARPDLEQPQRVDAGDATRRPRRSRSARSWRC